MPSAIDVFREQREAAEQLHARMQEISALLDQLRQQVNALALSDDLRSMLRQEQDWLTRAAGCL
jgi:C4-dicarboxylate-specific signal transduction histidine kinase